MVNTVIENIDTSRKNIDMVFSSWYEEVLTLANKVGVAEFVPRKTSFQRNRSNTPSESPSQHYKRNRSNTPSESPSQHYKRNRSNTPSESPSQHTKGIEAILLVSLLVSTTKGKLQSL